MYALERARALFDLADVRARYGDVAEPGPWDATMDLRDLLLVYERLTPVQKIVADGLLARPDDTGGDGAGAPKYGGVVPETPLCDANGCVHWVESGRHRALPGDGNSNGIPDYVEAVQTTLDTVSKTEVTDFGFRAPKSDVKSSNHGPDGKLDIYLADVGADGYYGYCTSDDPHLHSGYRYWDVSAYCVVDNDFDPGQFRGANGVAALQVTLAHEFFHAVQFAYDIGEDRWWMEATATWMEDEVYDEIDDNVRYLTSSPVTKPGTPIDSNNTSSFVYGDWIFFRFVSEFFGTDPNHDISVVRHAWNAADGAKGGRDQYSLQAIASATKAAGSSFRQVFAVFGAVNDVAPAWYDEGQSNNAGTEYPVPPLAAKPIKISKRHREDSDTFKTKHLTNTYVEFVPGKGVSSTAHLRIRLGLPDLSTGSAATAAVIRSSGVVSFVRAKLGKDGDGKLRLQFGKGQISAVDLVLTNASTRTRCWVDRHLKYSCDGNPKDDGVAYRYAASLDQ